jgi:predicted RNA-binding Zn ribbon-like protein
MSSVSRGGRYRVTAADGELALVQDLLNTAALPGPRRDSTDLLADPASAAAWLASAGADERAEDVARLRALRDSIRRALVHRDHPGEPAEQPGRPITASVRMRWDSDGTVTIESIRTPEADLTAQVLLAIHTAQLAGTWRRLKVCRNPDCRVAFWDQSRNTSAVWHDTRTCGNITNLRNSRARRRRTAPGPPQGG